MIQHAVTRGATVTLSRLGGGKDDAEPKIYKGGELKLHSEFLFYFLSMKRHFASVASCMSVSHPTGLK